MDEGRARRGPPAGAPPTSVLYAAPVDLPATRRQYNWTQRLTFAPPDVEVRALLPHKARIEVDLPRNVTPIRATFPGTAGFLLASIWLAVTARARRIDAFVGDRSSVALVAWACRRLGGYVWVLDIWDVPHKELMSYYPGIQGWRNGVKRAASRAKVAALSRLARRADLVLASVVVASLDRYEIPSSKIRLFRNALDTEPLNAIPVSPRREGTICFVNHTFAPDRGLATLTGAIERMVRARETTARVELVGELTARDRAILEASPAGSLFSAHGRVPLADAYKIMATCEIGVIPFDADTDVAYTYPLKLFEYMALGCVVVASDLPGIAAIVEQRRHGLLVPPADPRALAETLTELLRDDALRERLRTNARTHVQRFDAREKARDVYAAIAKATQPTTG